MASLRFKPIVAFMVVGSMFVSSTGAIAATAPASAPRQIAPWLALSALSGGAPAAAVYGTSAAVAQAAGQDAGPPPPTPVPPVEPASEGLGLGISPLYLALGAIAAGAAIYFLVIKKKHSNSPN